MTDEPRFFARNRLCREQAQFATAVSKLGVVPVVPLRPADDRRCIDDLNQSRVRQALYIPESGVDISDITNPLIDCIAPCGVEIVHGPQGVIYEVCSVDQARWAVRQGARGLILSGNEAAGNVGDDSSFTLFQKLKPVLDCPLWLRGGVGMHASATALAMGAAGVVLEDECCLFPEFCTAEAFRPIIQRLDGSETRLQHSHRFYINPPAWPKDRARESVSERFVVEQLARTPSPDNPILPIGQGAGLARLNKDNCGTLSGYLAEIAWAEQGHLRQACHHAATGVNARRFREELGIESPVAQGPMTRVSDIPEFVHAVAKEGGLPFFALAMMKGPTALEALKKTKELLNGMPWGVGVLGFVDKALQDEQFEYIKEVRPPFVLVAGGTPSHARSFERIGAKAVLHVPTTGLLDPYLKEGVKRFVFEGRECGGHVGPLSSLVLWEKQISRLLREESLDDVTVYFAGGIHDAFSAAFVNLMAAPLVAKGAKVGVLMGTAYLYTAEAVETGAILDEYQRQALDHKTTALIESGPGHVVRCLSTPFVEQFSAERHRLLESCSDTRQVRDCLEELNVGRLRVATKGITRTDEGLEPVGEEEQYREGLYMAGQVVSFDKEKTSIGRLHRQVTVEADEFLECLAYAAHKDQPASEDTGAIAIIGMACVMPEAGDMHTYWKNILQGENCIVEVPKSRWDSEKYYDPDAVKGSKSNARWGGFIPEIEFDPTEFGIPPQSLAAIDPAQLLSLKATKDALVDAGYWENEALDRENTAVIFGLEGGSELLSGYEMRANLPGLIETLPDELDEALPSLTEDSFAGTLPNVISGRIANRFDFRGRNFIVDAACASSLAAVDVACQELKSHRANVVVAGAVDLHNDVIDYLKFSSVGALSKRGSCRAFDRDADGIALGEGVGTVILKRAEDAVRDGDRIYAVIKGVGSSSDGKSLGLTAPRKSGQMMAYRRAYREAGVAPWKTGLIEAHGTGTVVGDDIELKSLTDFFSGAGALQGSIGLGSVKTQIGHTKCAAGMAALIKSSLAVYYGVKPPTANLTQPVAHYNERRSPFEFHEQAALWTDKERIAGISAFGFGGTNFHIVLQNAGQAPAFACTRREWPGELFVLRAERPDDLPARANDVLAVIEGGAEFELRDLAYTLAKENTNPVQATLVAYGLPDLIDKLHRIATRQSGVDIFYSRLVSGRTAFLFPGQGSQCINMARDLFVAFPSMRDGLPAGHPLLEILFPGRVFDEDEREYRRNRIHRTEYAQPLLGLVGLAVARLLNGFGVRPDELAGHSYGELPALTFAGGITDTDLVEISRARARAILDAAGDDPGAMLAVSMTQSELGPLIEAVPDLYLANNNTESQNVVAGTTAAIDGFAGKLDELGQIYKKLPVSCAFHSPLLERAPALFAEALQAFEFGSCDIPVWSNTSAAPYPGSAPEIKQRLCEHVIKPVKFHDQIKAMHEAGVGVFVEVGPGRVLSNMVASICGPDVAALSTDSAAGQGLSGLARMLAQYIATGREIDYDRFYGCRDARKLDPAALKARPNRGVCWKLKGGGRAEPLEMPMPAYGSKELKQPLRFAGGNERSYSEQTQLTEQNMKEKVILDYLDNMRAAIEAQHEALMRYLGQDARESNTPYPASEIPASVDRKHSEKAERESVCAVPANPVDDSDNTPASAAVAGDESTAMLASGEVEFEQGVFDIICEKTGYPVDMLSREMDLEADLSIDSIKRTEIVSKLSDKYPALSGSNAPGEMVQELSRLKTIDEMISCLSNHAAPAAESPGTRTGNESGQTGTSSSAVTGTDYKAFLLDIVSARTGYPIDMLDMDMDLEADLSIDSIKRTEIVNEITRQLNPRDAGAREPLVTRLAACKTLLEIKECLQSHAAGGQIPQSNQTAAPSPAEELDVPQAVRRYGLTRVKAPVHSAGNTSELKGKRIGVVEDGSDKAVVLVGHLSNLGVDVDMVAPGQDLMHLDGLIFFDLEASETRLTAEDIYRLAKSLDADRLRWFIGVSDVESRLAGQSEPETILDSLNGAYGFINSLNKEWDAVCRLVNIDAESRHEFHAFIVDELRCKQADEPVVYYESNVRYINQLTEFPWDERASELQSAPDDVVLVLGGAQGITAEILQSMAEVSPCHYILVGRTPLPPAVRDSESVQLSQSIDAIKKRLLAEQAFSSPRALEQHARQVFKQNQIVLTMRKLESRQASVSYYSMDLTRGNELEQLIGDLYQEYGKIDGIIHAAGHLEDKLLVDKSHESFRRVLDTKLNPLATLAKTFRPSLKYIALFSSVTSVFGNRGQVDYGTANSVFDQFASALDQVVPGRVMSINWGPWKGKGMIDDSLEADFLRRGVTLISLEEGAKAFVKELHHGRGGQAVLMTPLLNMERVETQF